MSVKELAIKAAELSLAVDADRWADIAAYVWGKELSGGSVYDRRDEDVALPGRRSNVIFGFMAFGCYQEKAKYIKGLLTIAELSHYQKEHGIDATKQIAALKSELVKSSGKYPDVDALLTVEQAETESFWDIY